MAKQDKPNPKRGIKKPRYDIDAPTMERGKPINPKGHRSGRRFEDLPPAGPGPGGLRETERPEPRKKGGPVKKKKTYIVGEKGPEIFVPKKDGKIIPNKKIEKKSR